ncbi:hypothetical protein TTHERM_00113110 (macronuclear) [Tetrahymena thermophila SB210]|uniref:Uncharacterized protein n=1 Tax=Tetrahymena thermophila (strain SB210) TaxID=312017 RepID=Q22Z60_TETTS|nr:hypothetical protein TTHERM_00113110 [Tetrahymena thermophila SB210]EAR90461.2 hypothetical protein TTHERM_00113110 [Tetrahymena thermophila SB210]|eukprot:XP_001010706.2 hypothetical protein TTHERM_00113110 [Tetrahymena thermophila SB210]
MDKPKQDKVICLDDEGEDVADSNSSDIMEEEENEVDKPSIAKFSNLNNNNNNKLDQVNGNKNSVNGSADKKKKKQRSTNKVSIEELTKQIKQNQSKRVNGQEDGVVIKANFDWVNYNTTEDKTLNYLSDFLKLNGENNLDYFKLDLVEFEDVNIVQHHSQVSSITDDLYKRILRYGQIENIQRIAKKSGAISKGEGTNVNFRDELYYDQNDPFIDDDEYNNTSVKVSHRMQLAEVFIDDFRTFDGDLKDFIKSEIYKNRVEIMHNLEKKNEIEEETENFNKKKKKPNPPSNPAISSSNNLSSNLANNSLTAALNSATATLNNKIQKKATADVEKDLNQVESVKTQEKKKFKKDNVNNTTSLSSGQQLQNAQNILQAAGLNQNLQSVSGSVNAQSLPQAVQASNLLLGADLSTSQLSQLLSQAQSSNNNNLLQNAASVMQMEYLKPQSGLGSSSYYLQPYYNQGIAFSNYLDPSQQLMLGQLDLSQNMMLYSTQPQANQIANNFMFSQGNAFNLTPAPAQSQANSNIIKSSNDPKDKKKKKKSFPTQNNNNNSSQLNKDNINNKNKNQQMNLIEIEDDDDPSQNTHTNQSTKLGVDSESQK